MYYIIFKTTDREVFVSKKEDLENIDKCVNVTEGTGRAPFFWSPDDASDRCSMLRKHLDEIHIEDESVNVGSIFILSGEEVLMRTRMTVGTLGTFSAVKIEGNDVTLTRYNGSNDDDEEEDVPMVYASIVDNVLYIAKDIDTGGGYETRIVWVSNQFTVTIQPASQGV